MRCAALRVCYKWCVCVTNGACVFVVGMRVHTHVNGRASCACVLRARLRLYRVAFHKRWLVQRAGGQIHSCTRLVLHLTPFHPSPPLSTSLHPSPPLSTPLHPSPPLSTHINPLPVATSDCDLLLSVDDLCRLKPALDKAQTKWYELGTRLGFSSQVLHDIEKNVRASEGEGTTFMSAMLEGWGKSLDPALPSWAHLIKCLRDVEEQDVAKEVEELGVCVCVCVCVCVWSKCVCGASACVWSKCVCVEQVRVVCTCVCVYLRCVCIYNIMCLVMCDVWV